MNNISFMTANFVAREINYQMTRGWWEGDTATSDFFRPEKTYAERFEAMIDEIIPLGFQAIDLWAPHLHPDWATPGQIDSAAEILKSRGLTVSSLAIGIPEDLDKLDQIATIAKAVGTRVIGGSCAPGSLDTRREELIAALEKHDLVFGYENHPEKTPEEILGKVGDSAGGRIGVTIDTGWFGSQKYTAASAIRHLSGRLVHVHLKDIFEPEVSSDHHDIRVTAKVNPTLKEMGHETCTMGDGCVGIEDCVTALKEIGYSGGISIEHEPEDHNPLEDIKVGYARLKVWLNQ